MYKDEGTAGPGAAAGSDDLSRIREAACREPYAGKMGMRCLEVTPGGCRVEMRIEPDMVNLFGTAHGGVIFSLLDEAFQIACNSHGLAALALNVSVTYVAASRPGDVLVAEAREVSLTSRTASYEVRVRKEGGELVATAQALAYRKRERAPFLE